MTSTTQSQPNTTTTRSETALIAAVVGLLGVVAATFAITISAVTKSLAEMSTLELSTHSEAPGPTFWTYGILEDSPCPYGAFEARTTTTTTLID